MQNKTKLILAITSVPVLAIGWALFRPELLFVNQSVNEKLPVSASQTVKPQSKGTFASYAHETTGTAQILEVDGKSVLRLSDFKTSNGPDVHVLLVKGTNPQEVKDGAYLDLGNIKGNQGDQNYTLPTGTNPSDYSSVTIWCKRFAVSFGGATLKAEGGKVSFSLPATTQTRSTQLPTFTLSAFQPGGDEIRVTGGKFANKKATAELVEISGKRFLRIKGTLGAGEVYIVKKESLGASVDFSGLTKVKLGNWASNSKKIELPVSKDLDVWLYRSVLVWDAKTQKPVSTANLRSDQELKRGLEQA